MRRQLGLVLFAACLGCDRESPAGTLDQDVEVSPPVVAVDDTDEDPFAGLRPGRGGELQGTELEDEALAEPWAHRDAYLVETPEGGEGSAMIPRQADPSRPGPVGAGQGGSKDRDAPRVAAGTESAAFSKPEPPSSLKSGQAPDLEAPIGHVPLIDPWSKFDRPQEGPSAVVDRPSPAAVKHGRAL